jgi:hypothetical protein
VCAVCENPSGEDWVPREGDISQNPEGGDEEGGENPGEEARIRKLHRMKERRPSTPKRLNVFKVHKISLLYNLCFANYKEKQNKLSQNSLPIIECF